MKITFFVPNNIVMIETYMITQIKDFINRGFEVKIYSFGKLKSHEQFYDEQYPQFKETISLSPPTNDLKKIKEIFSLFIKSKKKLKILKSLNSKKFPFLSKKLYLFYYALRFENIETPDLAICHFGHIGNILANLKEIGFINFPFITFFHGFDFNVLVKKFGIRFYQHLINSETLIFAVSENLYVNMIDAGFNIDFTKIHTMAVDPIFLSSESNLDRFKNIEKLKIVTVARLEEIKGVQFALKAMKLLSDKKNNFEYTLVGDGKYRMELENLAIRLDIEEKVKFVGIKNKFEIKEILDSNHIFILPSIVKEGSPIVLREAMARNVFCIGTNKGGTVALIEGTGFIVESKNEEEIYKAIISFKKFNFDDLINTKLFPARKKIESQFNIENLNPKLLDELKIRNIL